MNKEKFKIYTINTITLLKELARKAKAEADNPKENFENYNKGELMAYYSVFSLLKHQASVFNIDEKDIGLTEIEPNRDLI